MLRLLLLGLVLASFAPVSAWAEDEPAAEGPQLIADAEPDAPEAGQAEGGAAEGGEAAKEVPPSPLDADTDLAIWTLVIFIALLVVLRLVAWDPIVKGLQAREQGIVDNLDAAAQKHEDAKRLLAEHEAKITAATDEVREMMEEARRDAEHTKAEIVAEAQAAAEAERQRAIRDVEQARDSAVKQLAEQSANMAIDLAGKVVQSEITPQRQSEIVREALANIGSSNN